MSCRRPEPAQWIAHAAPGAGFVATCSWRALSDGSEDGGGEDRRRIPDRFEMLSMKRPIPRLFNAEGQPVSLGLYCNGRFLGPILDRQLLNLQIRSASRYSSCSLDVWLSHVSPCCLRSIKGTSRRMYVRLEPVQFPGFCVLAPLECPTSLSSPLLLGALGSASPPVSASQS